eukprot:6999364-Pyramimonas_sp.AAC.1
MTGLPQLRCNTGRRQWHVACVFRCASPPSDCMWTKVQRKITPPWGEQNMQYPQDVRNYLRTG